MAKRPLFFPTLAKLFLLVLPMHPAGPRDPIHSSTQMLVVTTADWNSVDGTLRRYERLSSDAQWVSVGDPIAVVVGKNGLAWGSGLVSYDEFESSGAAAPVKREGDGKAPAGIFRLSSIFGYAEHEPRTWRMPYISLTATIECVDDPASKFYNRIVDRNQVPADWNSSEHMLRPDDLYRWGIVVDHNADPPKAGDGSCIFLHIWRGPGQGTVGCTAMPQQQLEAILAWLDPKQKPVLVQAPVAQYSNIRDKLNLPYIRVTIAAANH